METKIPTNRGNLTIPEMMDILMWGSYKANRDLGASHENLIKCGIGNDDMKAKYESELNNPKTETT